MADTPTGAAEPRLRHQPAIDGLRAIAVVAVVLYHLDIDWAAGGYLGVEVFFVISGFLITSLMLAERLRTGRIDLRSFWIRRARRLLPALFLLLAGVVAYMVVAVGDELVDVRADVVAALAYATNWYLVAADVSYFEALGRPSAFQHLWSLAIEEQFYVLWPVIVAGGLALTKGRQRPLLVAMVLGAIASASLMAALFDPAADPSRLYYGTDTRASGLLLGAALAVVWAPWAPRRIIDHRSRAALDVGAAAALIGLVVLLWRLDEFSPWLYRGGFLLTAVLTCAVIAAVVHPATRWTTRLLATKPLVWIGGRSYSIYLWHWPVIVFSRPQLDTSLDGWQLLAFRLALTLVLSELSFRLVETPLRHGAAGRWWAALRDPETDRRRPLLLGASLLLPALLVGAALVRAEPAEQQVVSTADIADLIATTVPPTTTTTTAAPTTTTTVPVTETSAVADAGSTTTIATTTTAPTTTVATTTTTEARLPRLVVMAGDSVGHTMYVNLPSDLVDRFRVSDASIPGCGVFERGDVLTEGRRWVNFAGCAGFPERWARQAEGAELALVTLGAWEVFDLIVDGETHLAGSPSHDELVLEGLRNGIDALLGVGVHVALLEVPCFEPIDGGGLIAKPERGDHTRTAHVSELMRRAAAEYDGDVTVIAPPPEFCSDEDIATDVNLRWDGVHYGPLGGAFVWARLQDELLRIPLPQ